MSPTRIALVHSPLVGPRSWAGVAELLRGAYRDVIVPSLLAAVQGDPPWTTRCVNAAADAIGATGQPNESLVLVGHSGAGLLLPAIGHRLGVHDIAYVFVDATVPPDRGDVPTAEGWFRESVDQLPRVDGRLPRWSEWWGDGAMEKLIPDATLRRAAIAEMPSLPPEYFDESVPVPDGWSARPCGYLQLSDLFTDDGDRAEARGWPRRGVEGTHLEMLTDPARVAAELAALVDALVTE